MTSSAAASQEDDRQFGGRWFVLVLLTLVYALNIADRFVVSTLLEPIRLTLHLSDGNVSLITGIPLALFYVFVGLPVAVLADHANRRNIIAISLAVWSAMTAACGLAVNMWQFALARICVGIGEAGGTPPSTSLLADKFHARDRPMAMTVFALGAPVGAWLGASLAGEVAARYSWREAFLVLGIPGVIVALVVYFAVREPVRGGCDKGPPPEVHSLASVLGFLWRQRSAFHMIAGGTVATLWGWGLLWWTPTYLMRTYGMTVDAASATLGPMHLVAGSVATLATGLLVSARIAVDPRRVVWLLGGVVALATVPSIIVYWTHDRSVAVAMLWIVVPAIYFFIGPILGLLANVVPATMRAQSVAVLLFSANVANLIIAPQGIGLASYLLEPSLGSNAESLRWALLALAPTGFWAAWHYLTSARTLREEQAAVSGT